MSNSNAGFTYMPDVFTDELMHLITSEEWKVLVYTCRCVYSEPGNNTARMTQKSIANSTGMNHSTVANALTSLCHFGILTMLAPNNTQNQGAKYQINTDIAAIQIELLNNRKDEKNKKAAQTLAKTRNKKG